jgi:membrane protease YdiL (CAAX protease family)
MTAGSLAKNNTFRSIFSAQIITPGDGKIARVNESQSRIWKKVSLYYTLTLLFSGVFNLFILNAGKMDAANGLYVTGAMWSPGLAALLTKKIFAENIRDLPWNWGRAKYVWLGYLVPIAYSLPVYLFVWFAGLGGFASADFVSRTAQQFGSSHLPTNLTLALFILITATLGLVGKTSRALGEEIGWRGFLVPELAKVVSFPAVGLISGLMWAVYHYPALIFADYNAGAPAWYSLSCFTAMVVADSFILAWLTLRSRSLWPAAILHGSHNLFIQSIFTPLTRDTGPTKYVIDEFGLGLVITITIGAIIAWRKMRRVT